MNSLKFIPTMTGHLAWPVALAIAALALRNPLLRLLKNISTVRYGGAEVSFEREAVEVELALRESAEEQGVEPSVLQIEPSVTPAQAQQVGRVVDGWKRVEGALRRRVEKKTGEAPKRSSNMLRLAMQHELLTADQIQSLNGLRIMRNLAVHGLPSKFSEKHATQFVVLADALVTLLDFQELGNPGEHSAPPVAR